MRYLVSLGANGAGKTTTIRTLLGLHEPTKGKLLVHGQRFDASLASWVGYLPEERGLYRNEPVLMTMVYFGILHGLSRAEATKRRKRTSTESAWPIKQLNRSSNYRVVSSKKFSSGVTIMHEPSLMILDEPTEALDPVNRSLLMDIIEERAPRVHPSCSLPIAWRKSNTLRPNRPP